MLFNWWRKKAEQRNRQHPASQRHWLAFERLEDRCVPSAKPIAFGAAGLVLPDQPGKDLPSLALPAGNDRLSVSPSTFHDASAVDIAGQIGWMGAPSLVSNTDSLS